MTAINYPVNKNFVLLVKPSLQPGSDSKRIYNNNNNNNNNNLIYIAPACRMTSEAQLSTINTIINYLFMYFKKYPIQIDKILL